MQSEPILKPNYDSYYYMAFGTGADGTVDFDGSSVVLGITPSSNQYTLNRDIFPRNMRIRAGVTVKTQGFAPFVAGKTTIDATGVLCFRANDASGITAGAAFTSIGTLLFSSGAGGDGRNTTGNGNNGTGAANNNCTGANAGGGGGAPGRPGGTGGSTSAPVATQGSINDFGVVLRRRYFGSATAAWNGSGGGGGGGADVTGGACTSGAGGGAAGVLLLFSRELENYGVIHADGGLGSDATGSVGGIGGGGGGGGAGAVILAIGRIISEGTVRAAAGIGGLGFGAGSTSGSNGTTSGNVLKFYGQPQ